MKYKLISMAFLLTTVSVGGAQLANNHSTTTRPGTGVVNKVETVKPEASTTNNTTSNSKENTTTTTANKKPVASNNVSNTTNTVKNDVNNSKFMAQVEQSIYKQVNEQRVKAGLEPLSYNSTMQTYARNKSEDMAKNNYFNHRDKQGKLVADDLKADGVSYSAWGENIAYIGGMTDPTALANKFMTNWMNSPGHRANILSPNFKSMGVGVYQSGNRVYATQEFFK